MDDYLGSYFSDDEQSETVSLAARPEIRDALRRILRLRNPDSGFIVIMGQSSDSNWPQVKLLHMVIICEYGSIPHEREYVVWVDDFELTFTFIDVSDWSEWGSVL
jgi:hypothetical protein